MGEKHDALRLPGQTGSGSQPVSTDLLEGEGMVPAVGFGTLVLQGRENDTRTRDLAASVNDPQTQQETIAERTMLHDLRATASHRSLRCPAPNPTGA